MILTLVLFLWAKMDAGREKDVGGIEVFLLLISLIIAINQDIRLIQFLGK